MNTTMTYNPVRVSLADLKSFGRVTWYISDNSLGAYERAAEWSHDTTGTKGYGWEALKITRPVMAYILPASPDGHHALVQAKLQINVDQLMIALTSRAMRNKTGRATALGGSISVTVKDREAQNGR